MGKMKDLDIALRNSAKSEVHQTVNISRLTSEQLRRFLSGELTWEWAHEQAPGADIIITEVEPEEFDSISVEEQQDGEE